MKDEILNIYSKSKSLFFVQFKALPFSRKIFNIFHKPFENIYCHILGSTALVTFKNLKCGIIIY